jgi:outer membrane protein OmpA-like peptidoglycan-associated protein
MNKFLFSAICAAAMTVALPSAAQEVTYVEDCSQGLLLNQNKDNWFITGRGGATFSLGRYDHHADFTDRVGAIGSLYAGKWLTPTFGLRFGLNMEMMRGATIASDANRDLVHGQFSDGYYPKKYYGLGVEVDGLINLTNWWCGYKPDRVYNAILHGGFGNVWPLTHKYNSKNEKEWCYEKENTVFYANVGLENDFNITKSFTLFIDVQAEAIDFSRKDYNVSLSAGFTYKFKKRDWNCPVTAVCPTWKYTDAEGDALTARLASADAKIRDLQRKLDDCLKRPVESKVVNDCDALATVYYPINVSTIGKREAGVLTSVAQVMKDHPDTKYELTGWADNYTGTDEINVRLRNARVDGVKDFLVKSGVNADQLITKIDNNNLTDFGAKSASMDRAVTIKEAK